MSEHQEAINHYEGGAPASLSVRDKETETAATGTELRAITAMAFARSWRTTTLESRSTAAPMVVSSTFPYPKPSLLDLANPRTQALQFFHLVLITPL